MIYISFVPRSAARTSGRRPGSDRVDLFRVEIEVDIAAIALTHRLGTVSSKSGISHRLPAEGAIEDEPYILGLEVSTVASRQVESEKAKTEKRFAGDPGDLAIELSLGHVLLLRRNRAQPKPPCHAHREPGARWKTGLGNGME